MYTCSNMCEVRHAWGRHVDQEVEDAVFEIGVGFFSGGEHLAIVDGDGGICGI